MPVGCMQDFHESVVLMRVEPVFGKKLSILQPKNGLFRYERNNFAGWVSVAGAGVI